MGHTNRIWCAETVKEQGEKLCVGAVGECAGLARRHKCGHKPLMRFFIVIG